MDWLIVLINLAITLFNSACFGLIWDYRHKLDPMTTFVFWMGALMAFAGWFQMAVIAIVLVGPGLGLVPPEMLEPIADASFIILVIIVIGSGTMLWAYSVREAWRRPTVANLARAGWNTYAMIRNVGTAMQYLPEATSGLSKALSGGTKSRSSSSSSSKDLGKALGPLAMLLVLIAYLAVAAVMALAAFITVAWIAKTLHEQAMVSKYGPEYQKVFELAES